MTNSPWNLFPYPTYSEGVFLNGSVMAVHDDCRTCSSMPCLNDKTVKPGDVQQCRFGLCFSRIDTERLVLGFVGDGLQNPTSRTKRRYRDKTEKRVKVEHVETAVARAISLGPGVVRDFEQDKAAVVERLSRDPELQKAIAGDLRRDFDQDFNRSHDFLQLTKLVRGNAEALLAEVAPGVDVVTAAETHKEQGAIYFTTELMLMKMNSLKFLSHVNSAFGGEEKFQIHPFVLKHVRIYDWQAKQKSMSVQVYGNCRARVTYNTEAISAIIQAYLDNMVKYAPAGSSSSVVFAEKADSVTITFSSLGPKIEKNETKSIFLAGIRASAARAMATGGQGVGLAAAKVVADALQIQLSVTQSETEDERFRTKFSTSFAVTFQTQP
ncbi:ATP-binding protein [Arthrobacter sp. EH-1B-1]|uniref:Sensor-like histidine kinase SenX3 n=1 Tax=Arthrobacter vasquezii TaxID=2977629 RepID=A0ABT6CTW9_9MICC|nr:ATP-binding protein [Arthrobacter vasquezii]MDF9277478.1 ATP-binding protein [Arthrobacter vasquezii]